MSCPDIDYDKVCDEIQVRCPWVRDIRCVTVPEGTAIYLEFSDLSVSATPVCTIPRGFNETEICDIILPKLPKVAGEGVTYDLASNTYTVKDKVTALSWDSGTKTISYVNEADEVVSFSIADCIPTVVGNGVTFNPATNEYTVKDQLTKLGFDTGTKILKYTDEELGETDINIGECIPTLKGLGIVFDPANNCYTATDRLTSIRFDDLTKEIVYIDELGAENRASIASCIPLNVYNPADHSISFGGVTQLLNVGRLDFDPNTCQLSYTDERGDVVSYFLPRDSFVYDPANYTLTVVDGKTGTATVVRTGVPESEVSLGMLDGKILELTYGNSKCQVSMPNALVGCSYTAATNTLRMIHCDGTFVDKALPKAVLNCTTLPDGTQVLNFDNGIDAPKMFNIPSVQLDTDDVTLAGSTLTFTYGGDGNDKVVVVDICDVVANNCNATIIERYDDGGFDFRDNAGNLFEIRPVNCCTFHGVNPNTLSNDTPPASPIGVWPSKKDRDTAVEWHPNGLVWWTCINGNWSLDFYKVFTDCCSYHINDNGNIDPDNPPIEPPASPRLDNKADGDTAIAHYANGWAAWTCVNGAWQRDWYKVYENCCTYNLTTVEVLEDGVTPTAPSDPKLANKADRDTAYVCHPNGWAAWTCVDGAWVLDWTKITAVAPTHTSPDGTVNIVFDPVANEWQYQVVLPATYDPEKETFGAGETLPAAPDSEEVIVCVDNGGDVEEITVPAGGALPSNMVGWVQVDETDGTTRYVPPKSTDCCHYHSEHVGVIDPDNPPTAPGNAPALGLNKSEGDTLHECWSNGSCYFTCRLGVWDLDFCKTAEDPKCCVVQRMCHPDAANEDVFQTMELTTRIVVVRDSNGVKIDAVPAGYEPCDDNS